MWKTTKDLQIFCLIVSESNFTFKQSNITFIIIVHQYS